MNDGDKILELQNTDEVINLLAAQRQMYSDAKVLYCVCGVAAIAPPVIAAVVPNLPVFPLIACVIVPVVLVRVLTSLAENRQREAASVQQLIDSFLFGLTFSNVDHDERLAARRSLHYRERKGASDLLDWYTGIAGLPAGKAEYECQRSNICWTKDLATIAGAIDLIVAVIAAGIAAVGIRDSGVNSIEYVLLAPIIVWAVECGLDRLRLRKATKRIKNSMEDLWKDDEYHVGKAQDFIFEYRCLRPVPDFIYKLTKDSEQQRIENRI